MARSSASSSSGVSRRSLPASAFMGSPPCRRRPLPSPPWRAPARSVESSTRIGLELLMWTRILRFTGNVAEGRDRAVGTAHAHMSHALSRLGAETAAGSSRRPATACRRTARPTRRPAAASRRRSFARSRGCRAAAARPRAPRRRPCRPACRRARRAIGPSRARAPPCPARRTTRPARPLRAAVDMARLERPGRAAPPGGARNPRPARRRSDWPSARRARARWRRS